MLHIDITATFIVWADGMGESFSLRLQKLDSEVDW